MNESGVDESLQEGKGCSLYIYTSAASFVFCLFLFYVISPRFSSLISTGYRELPVAKKLDWDTRIGSNLHAVVVSSISLYCFFFDAETTSNPIVNDAILVRMQIAITMGYILADFLIIILSYKYIGDLFTVVHHIMAIWAYYFVVVYGVLTYFANLRQLAEISTPFVNQRWFFDAISHPRSSRGFFVNGYVMGGSFFLCRIMIMPIYYYKCYSVWGTEEQRNLGVLISFYWISTCIVLDAINFLLVRQDS
ncbi:TLC domain [Desmophyllum pertusum]|uniref:TLC domain n=1 Tax=Desmophyllum pertusum TaxID=174260 RepID=A0A9W9ZRB7_9CNID|nr:TLC domain [Desmophyllum pertusum]